jgi:putative copper export protein
MPMLPVDMTDIRLFLHVFAAAIWVGGQFTLAGLVPRLRAIDADAPRAAGRRFAMIAWPAFGLLVITGIWNLVEVDIMDTTSEYQVTLLVKLLVVALSGIAAALHTQAVSRAAIATWGAIGGVSALAAMFLGIQLHG